MKWKIRWGLWFAAIMCTMIAAEAKEEVTPSEIKEVLLLSDQAAVTREASLHVGKGMQKVYCASQAFHVDQDSLSAKVQGVGEIVSVQFVQIPQVEPPQEEIAQIEQQIKSLQQQKELCKGQQWILEEKEKFLNSLAGFSQVQVPQDMKTQMPEIARVQQTIDFLETNYDQILKKKLTLDLEEEQIEKQIQVLKDKLAALHKPYRNTQNTIEIAFDSAKEQDIKVTISYVVFNCFWQPVYKLNVAQNLENVHLTMFAKLRQTTGESWNDVQLSVSNVMPLQGMGLPSLGSWFLEIQEMGAFGGEKKYKADRMREMIEDKACVAQLAPAPEATYAQAQRKSQAFSFEYVLPQTLTIPSEDKDTLVPLFTKDIKGDFMHYTAPGVIPLTYLVYHAKPDSELLPGYLNVYLGGVYQGKTFLDEKKAQEAFFINIGADRQVKVKREKTKDVVTETFLGKIERKTIIRDFVYTITVENSKEKPVKIQVFDVLPVSKTDKIEVKDVKITPEPTNTDYEGKAGLCLWKLDLAKGESKKITLEYRVTYPKDEHVVGL